MKATQRLETLVQTGGASLRDMEALGYDAVRAVKSDPERVQFRDFAPETKITSTGERRYRFTFSTEKPDRVSDIIRQGGWVLDDFRDNPASLWSHDGRSQPPIGRVEKLNTKGTVKGFRSTDGDIQLAPEGASSLIDTINVLLATEFLKATSVGFMILAIKIVEDEDERAKLGLGRFGMLITKARLKEVSIVSIGMHQDALAKGCDEALTAGKYGVTKEGVAAFMQTVPMCERDYARIVKELCKETIALPAWVEPWSDEEKENANGDATHAEPEVDGAKTVDEEEAELAAKSHNQPEHVDDLEDKEGDEMISDKTIEAFTEVVRSFVERIETSDGVVEQLATELGKVAECVADLCDRLEVAEAADSPDGGDESDSDASKGNLAAVVSELQGLADAARESVSKAQKKPDDDKAA